MQCTSLFKIKQGDTDQASAIALLDEALTPATYEDAVYWVGRFLAHYPARQTTKDGIILSDLGGDVVEMKIPVAALVKALDTLRREASIEKPFLPPSGEILSRANKISKEWNDHHHRLAIGCRTACIIDPVIKRDENISKCRNCGKVWPDAEYKD